MMLGENIRGGAAVTQVQQDRPIYLRQWVGSFVRVQAANNKEYSGRLTNIVFDEKRLMYIVLDDLSAINFDHIIEIRLQS